jgi:hypothetical protein
MCKTGVYSHAIEKNTGETNCRKYIDNMALIKSAVQAFFFGVHAVCAFV